MSAVHTDCGATWGESVAPPRAMTHPNDEPLVISLLRSLSAVCSGLPTLLTSPSTVLFTTSEPWRSGDVLSHHSSDSYPLYCSLVLLLCRWVAERVAIPADSELSAVLRQTPSVRLVRGSCDSRLPVNSRLDCDEDDERGCGLYCSTAALADCRVSTLLPAPPSQLINAAIAAVMETHRDTSSGEDGREACIDVVLSHLCAVTSPPAADGGASDHPMHCAIVALRDAWCHVKDRFALKPSSPVQITEGDISALLYMYAESSVELASSTLLQTLTAAAVPVGGAPEAEMAAIVASLGAVHEIIVAQQAANASALHIAPEPALELIIDRIGALVVALLGASPSPSSRAQFYLHSSVTLSIDPSHSVAGCGLVAIHAVREGELLTREAALAIMAGAEVERFHESGSGLTSTAASTAGPFSDTTPFWKESARRCPGDDDDPHVVGDATAALSAWARQREESAQFVAENGERSAALRLLSLLAHFPDLLVRGWKQWAVRVMHDACALQLSGCGSQVPTGEAQRLQEAAAPKDVPREDVSFTPDLHLRRRASWPEGTMHAFLLPAPQLLLDLRGVDEFRIEPPSQSYRYTQGDGRVRSAKAELERTADETDVAARVSAGANHAPVKALFPFLRHLNHACIPNAILVLDKTPGYLHGSDGGGGVVASLVALRTIERGEEITVSYVPATTALTVSQMELSEALGFRCRCHLCTQRAALLRGHVCPACQQLVYEPGSQVESGSATGFRTTGDEPEEATVFRHLERCPQRRRTFEMDDVTEDRQSVVIQLQRELDDITEQLAVRGTEGDDQENAQDPAVAVVRRLLDLDACVARTLLPTHFLRLRLRLEVFAYSTVARGLGSTVSAELIHLCASTLQELEMFMPANHPLLTGLRMYLVFSRGRHLQAVNAADHLARGARHEDCCGAVREQAALMQLPFVVDPLVRRCVARCFQEHYVQLLAWRPAWLSRAGAVGILGSFLARYSVELEACGVTTSDHMELLSCMEDGTEYA
ncbi:hypothetical protein JKF63_02062 [Porcisia hertigi]|uniref:SET domain-containing protein n=1 Tax=Porcisia hertigi TaxID=2761500 RepID=A0A836IGQ3_9TRYP|nr:hypothetical protein JKF63_02062 [Porcisia hertigi]